jgi:ABC-type cobalamin/Fe3+-siderophores transport system ATPase subunit
VADGPPDQVLDAALLDRVFGLRARIGRDKDGILFQALGVTR